MVGITSAFTKIFLFIPFNYLKKLPFYILLLLSLLFIYLFTYLFIYLFIHLFIYLLMYFVDIYDGKYWTSFWTWTIFANKNPSQKFDRHRNTVGKMVGNRWNNQCFYKNVFIHTFHFNTMFPSNRITIALFQFWYRIGPLFPLEWIFLAWFSLWRGVGTLWFWK